MRKLIKLSLQEAMYDNWIPNKLIGCPNSSSTMTLKEVKLSRPLFLKSQENELLIIQVYIDEVIFEATFELLCEEFVAFMVVGSKGERFEISSNSYKSEKLKRYRWSSRKYICELLKWLNILQVKKML